MTFRGNPARLRWTACVALAGAMTLAACGSSSGSSFSSGAATSASSDASPTTSSTTMPDAAQVTKVPFTGSAPTDLTAEQISAAKGTLANASTLQVCTSLPSVPFEVQDANGQVVGFDMDFMRQVASLLGVSMKVVDVPFSSISSGQAMLSKKCDIAAAGMSILPERRATIEFSNPYFDTEQGLLTEAGSGISSLSDLKGKRVAAQNGTTGLTVASSLASTYGYTVVQFDDQTGETQAVQSGQAAAAINDVVAWASYLKQNPKTHIAVTINTGAQMGFGAAKGNTALIAVANYVLAKAQSDGGYKQSYEKWIGTAPSGD